MNLYNLKYKITIITEKNKIVGMSRDFYRFDK